MDRPQLVSKILTSRTPVSTAQGLYCTDNDTPFLGTTANVPRTHTAASSTPPDVIDADKKPNVTISREQTTAGKSSTDRPNYEPKPETSNEPTVAASKADPKQNSGLSIRHYRYCGSLSIANMHPPVDNSAVKATRGRPPAAISPSRYQMPPPFQPASRPYGMMNNGDIPCGPPPPMPNGPVHMHHSHPSTGSIHFGTFQDSQTPSPAPPHTGGIVPPPGIATADARPAYMGGPGGNGFPPMIPPYGAEMMQPGNFDNYGPPAMTYGPMENFPPYGNNFGPSTPHSFRDSHSSGPADDNGMYHQYPPNGQRNGATGPGESDGLVANHQGRVFGHQEYPRMMPGRGHPHQMAGPDDNGDGFLGYMQQQFANHELADCTLELRYVDDRAAPVRIPGHRVIFARSGTLADQVKKQIHQVSSDRALQTLLLKTGSKWIRSDSFYMAVQRLYGLPLLSMPPRDMAESADVTDAGTCNEQLEFALSYAAAGHLLEWAPVIRRGCEVATQLLSWQTLEKVIEFALDGYNDTGSHVSYKYGEGSSILLNALVTFIVHNLPPSFNLDTSAEDPMEYARLPECPPPPPAAKKRAPVIARGSSVLGMGRRSQQITGIQFGDLSLAEEANTSDSVTPKATRQAQPVPHVVLSRALINLPFAQLKMILESAGSGNVNGWANAESRYRIIRSAVEEREARRLRTVDAVLRGRVQTPIPIRSALCNPVPQDMWPWTALGWQEEILPYGNADGPSLGRKWVPFSDPQREPPAAYP